MGRPKTHTAERQGYYCMKQRCYNKNNTNYPLYGGRGISICDEWLYSFANFYKDMGERPKGTTLDRVDSSGNYEPSNCRWATIDIQNRNKSDNVNLTYNGKTQCVKDWERELKLPRDLVQKRLKRGWSVERALTTPPSPQRNPSFNKVGRK